jgi:hypothetical protein
MRCDLHLTLEKQGLKKEEQKLIDRGTLSLQERLDADDDDDFTWIKWEVRAGASRAMKALG